MARASTWTNADGLQVGFGARDTFNLESGEIHTKGHRKELELRLHYSSIPSLATGVARTTKSVALPAGAVVRQAYLTVVDAFTGLTVTTGRLAVGTVDAAGASISSKGLIGDTAEAALATNATVEGAGALVDGTASTAVQYIAIEMTGANPTAGEGLLTIVYDEPAISTEAPAVITGEI